MAWKEMIVVVGVLVVWFSLMRFVLPALGVPTCMSGACQVGASADGGSQSTGKPLMEDRGKGTGHDSRLESVDVRSEEP